MADPTGTRTASVRKRQRKSGVRYEARWWERDKDTCRAVVRGKTFRTEAEAKFHLDEVRHAKNHRTYVPVDKARQTFAVVAEGWFAAKERTGRKQKTLRGYRFILDTWLAPWHACAVGDLSIDDVDALLIRMGEAGRSSQTVRNVFNVAKGVLDRAVKQRLISFNPCTVMRDELPAQRQALPTFLSARQVAALAAELPEPYGLLVTFAAWSGLRAGELAGLRVRRLDPLRATVRVEETVVSMKGGLVADTPKSDRSRRTVPIAPALARLVSEHVAAHGLAPDDYLFGKGSEPLNHGVFYQRLFKPAAARIGLAKLRFHDLRHTYAALMDQQGEKVHHISRWMGHSTIKITVDTYMRAGLFGESDDGLRSRQDAAFLGAASDPQVTLVAMANHPRTRVVPA